LTSALNYCIFAETQPDMKPGLFSFIGDEFENIFHYSDLFLPGIEKIVGIFYSGKERQLRILSRIRDEAIDTNYDEVLLNRENLVMIQKFRSESHQFNWIRKDDLPFELPHKPGLIPPNLFTELENVILVLHFKNETDLLNDLLLIYFNKSFVNFGLNKSDKVLGADHKTIIGHILYYQFKSFIQMNQANRRLLHSLNNVVRSVINDNRSLKDQLIQIQASYGENIVNIARQHLQDLAKDYGRNYILADEAVEKIRGFKGNLKHLRTIMENAVVFTENLLLLREEETVSIQSYSLDFDSYQVIDKSEPSTRKIDSRQSKAMQLLDRLESAAKLLKSRNIPLISSKIGQALKPPVSAPAITDALGKNRNIIRLLIEKYPEKWEIIRNDFRPLLNQLRKTLPEIREEESA
jgi:hypothetical protein